MPSTGLLVQLLLLLLVVLLSYLVFERLQGYGRESRQLIIVLGSQPILGCKTIDVTISCCKTGIRTVSEGVHLLKTEVLGLAGSVEVVEPRVSEAVIGVVLSLLVCAKAILVSSHGLDGTLSTNLVHIYHVCIRSDAHTESTNISVVDLVRVLGMDLLVQLLLCLMLEFV